MEDEFSRFGAWIAIIGAVLIAGKINVEIGFWLYLISSALLTVWSYRMRIRNVFLMNLVFTVINIIGVIRWR